MAPPKKEWRRGPEPGRRNAIVAELTVKARRLTETIPSENGTMRGVARDKARGGRRESANRITPGQSRDQPGVSHGSMSSGLAVRTGPSWKGGKGGVTTRSRQSRYRN